MDLTEIIERAGKISSESNHKILIDFISKYSALKSFEVDWDIEDGEQWGKLFDNSNQVLMFHSSLPLIFVSEKYFTNLKSGLENIEVSIGTLQSWDEKLYSIDLLKVSEIIPVRENAINIDNFSINDFWYATI